MNKIKVLTISDHPLSPSGVGTQTRGVIESLLATGKFQFNCLAGAVKHNNYQPVKTEEWGDDWAVFPVDGYGSPEIIRSMIRSFKPDILWFMTDPRFFGWLWEMEDEIRPLMPMIYYHVWDNYPYPTYNKNYYDSCDIIATISKVTDDIVKTVSPNVESYYLPHAVPPDIFKPLDKKDVEAARVAAGFKPEQKVFFWNNRNARRKQSGSLIFWFKDFLDKVGHDKAILLMHTEPKDEAGQDLEALAQFNNLLDGQFQLSATKVPPEQLAMMYNMADCTINIADAEGFGLSSLESLACGTPIINTMTGGLQEQVTNGKDWFGVGIEPASKAVIGSQHIPWIYEDRVSGDDVVNALLKIYELTNEQRDKIGEMGRQHVHENYNFKTFQESWVELMTNANKKYGSWENRKNYNKWEFTEIK